MRDPLFIFEKNGVQVAIAFDLGKESELLASGWRHIATIEPVAYLMHQINNNGMKVEE